MASLPIKSDLFRFVSQRSPQSIDYQKRQTGFIWHPDPGKSEFLKNIQDITNLKIANEALQVAAASFAPIQQYAGVRAIDEAVYDFAFWMQQDGRKLKADIIRENAESLDPLSESALLRVWDNLLYQLLERRSAKVRNACILMLRGQHLLSHIKQGRIKARAMAEQRTPKLPEPPTELEAIESFITKIQFAKVVVPKAFSRKRLKQTKDQSGKREVPDLQHLELKPASDFDQINVVHQNGLIRARNDRLRGVKQDLNAAKRQAMRKRQPLSVGSIIKNPDIQLADGTREFLSKSVSETADIQTAIKSAGDSLRRESKRILGPSRN
ncbi:MAG: hypothetical protein AAGH65_06785, partial [Pseudomonadota bacterium]